MAKRRGGRRPAKPPSRPPNAGECPACGAPVVWMVTPDGVVTPTQPQRRLVLFTFKADEHGLPLEEEKPIVAFDERTGRLVLGRAAHPMEAKRFKDHGNPGKPYTVAREGHLRACTRWDRWLSGEAQAPPSDTLAGR